MHGLQLHAYLSHTVWSVARKYFTKANYEHELIKKTSKHVI